MSGIWIVIILFILFICLQFYSKTKFGGELDQIEDGRRIRRHLLETARPGGIGYRGWSDDELKNIINIANYVYPEIQFDDLVENEDILNMLIEAMGVYNQIMKGAGLSMKYPQDTIYDNDIRLADLIALSYKYIPYWDYNTVIQDLVAAKAFDKEKLDNYMGDGGLWGRMTRLAPPSYLLKPSRDSSRGRYYFTPPPSPSRSRSSSWELVDDNIVSSKRQSIRPSSRSSDSWEIID